MTTTTGQNKCAHLPCRCTAQANDKYCGPACKDAGAKEVEIACQCDHEACPLTVWRSSNFWAQERAI
jgi:hypothetical protein